MIVIETLGSTEVLHSDLEHAVPISNIPRMFRKFSVIFSQAFGRKQAQIFLNKNVVTTAEFSKEFLILFFCDIMRSNNLDTFDLVIVHNQKHFYNCY